MELELVCFVPQLRLSLQYWRLGGFLGGSGRIVLGWDHGTKNRVVGKSGSRRRFINAMNEFISRPRDRMIVRISAASGPVCSCICIQVVGEFERGVGWCGRRCRTRANILRTPLLYNMPISPKTEDFKDT